MDDQSVSAQLDTSRRQFKLLKSCAQSCAIYASRDPALDPASTLCLSIPSLPSIHLENCVNNYKLTFTFLTDQIKTRNNRNL